MAMETVTMETQDGIITSSGSSSASSDELKRPRNCITSHKRKDSLLSRWKKSGLAFRRYLNCLDAKQSDSSTDEELFNKVKTTKNNYIKKSSMTKHPSNIDDIDQRLTDGSANGATKVQNNNRISMARKCLHRDKICHKGENYVYGECCTANGLLTDDYLSLHSSRNCTTDTDQSDWCQSTDLIESTCDCCSSQCDNYDMTKNCLDSCHACKKMDGDQTDFYSHQGQDEDNICSDHSKLLLDQSENHKLYRTERFNKPFKRSKISVNKCLTDKTTVETSDSGNNGIQGESDITFCIRCHSEITISKKYQDVDVFCRKCQSAERNFGIFKNSSKTSYVDKSSERTFKDYSRNSTSKNLDKFNIKNDDMIHKRERISLTDKKNPLKRENHRLTSIQLHSDSLSAYGKVDHSSMKHSLPEESPVVTEGYNGEDISDDIVYLESAIDYSPSGFLSSLARMSLENLSEESTDKIHVSDDDSLPTAPSSIPGLNFAMPYLSDRLKNSIAQRLGQEGNTDIRNDQTDSIDYQESEHLADSEDEESFQGRQLVVDQSIENMTEDETLTDLLTNLEKIDMINNLLLSDQDDWDISRQIGTTADTNQNKDEENGSDGGEADDEFECDCQFCVGSSLDGDGCHNNEEVAEDRISHESSEQNVLSTVENTDYGFNFWMSDREDEDDSMFTINIEELSPLDLLMNDRRSELELMFENVIIQMLAVHPDLLGEQAPPPAAQSTIQNLPITPVTSLQISQSLSCPICLCIFEECDSTTTLPCRHHFHPLCIKAWLSKSGTCPVCRFTLE